MRQTLGLVSLALLVTAAALAGCGDDWSSEVGPAQGELCTPPKLTPVTAVSSPSPKQAASRAIDNNVGTRWESAFSDPQWIYVDLGAVKTITEVKIEWQRSGGKDYRVDVSNDAVNWSAPVVTKTGMPAVDHRIDDLTGFSVSARYVRVYGTARTTVYGYSIWELSIYGTCTGSTGAAGVGGAGMGGAGMGPAGMGPAGMGGAGTGGGACKSDNLTTSTTLVATASSGTPSRAFDNSTTTRWESAFSDPQWIVVDLGAVKAVRRIRIDWETAAAKDYRIDVSNNGTSWSAPIVTKTGMPGTMHRIDDLTGLAVSARFVRMYGTARATVYGYSIWEMDIYGDANPDCSGGGTGAAGTGAAGTGAAGMGAAGMGAAGAGGFTACVNGALTLVGAVASSNTQPASRAIDNSLTTRWESASSDPQWIYADLGSRKAIRQVKIDWETASAAAYEIDVSDDAVVWSPILTRAGLGSVQHRKDDTMGIFGSGRYLRIFGTQRSTQFGYSIWELGASGDANPSCGNLLTPGWDPSNVNASFTPVAGYTLNSSNKNAISFDYTGKTFTTPNQPPLLEFIQTFTIPKAGTQWRVTLDISGMNDQANLPPLFLATLAGVPVTVYLPATTTVASSAGQLVRVGSLTTGRKLIMDFGLSLGAGDIIDLVLDNVPTFSSSGGTSTGLQKFNVTDVTLERLDLN